MRKLDEELTRNDEDDDLLTEQLLRSTTAPTKSGPIRLKRRWIKTAASEDKLVSADEAIDANRAHKVRKQAANL